VWGGGGGGGVGGGRTEGWKQWSLEKSVVARSRGERRGGMPIVMTPQKKFTSTLRHNTADKQRKILLREKG